MKLGRWFRFSLRTFFVLLCFCAVCLAWLADRTRLTRRIADLEAKLFSPQIAQMQNDLVRLKMAAHDESLRSANPNSPGIRHLQQRIAALEDGIAELQAAGSSTRMPKSAPARSK